MALLFHIALKHLLARRRQSVVSLSGIVLGVAFFLAISSLMKGSEKDFLKRLVDNSAHITVQDQFRTASIQPLTLKFPDRVTQILRVGPLTETRGIRDYRKIVEWVRRHPHYLISPSLQGNGIVTFAGKDQTVTLNGMVPEDIFLVTSLKDYMQQGSIDQLLRNPDGVIIGEQMAKKLSLNLNDILTITAAEGRKGSFKIVGIFRFGRASIDETQTYLSLKRVQALLNRPDRINNLIMKIQDPHQAFEVATALEKKFGYKAVSWQENSEDLMNTIKIRNNIMYTVVSAVLLVAIFGIYNVISTVVMEKQRDIAILKSIGFQEKDIKRIFLAEGITLGLCGCLVGLPLGMLFMGGLMQIRFKPPGGSQIINMPVDWGWEQFAVASLAAITSSIIAAYLPARKAACLMPVDILRGGF